MQDLEVLTPSAKPREAREQDPAQIVKTVESVVGRLQKYAGLDGVESQKSDNRSTIQQDLPGWIKAGVKGLSVLKRRNHPEANELERQFNLARKEAVKLWAGDALRDLEKFIQGTHERPNVGGEGLMREAQLAMNALTPEESSDLTQRWNALKPKALERWTEQMERSLTQTDGNKNSKTFAAGVFRANLKSFREFASGIEGGDALIKRLEALEEKLDVPLAGEAPEKTNA